MFKLEFTETEEKLAEEFKKRHKDCTLEDCESIKVYYTGLRKLWRRLLGKPLFYYKLGPYPDKFTYLVDTNSGIGIGVSIRCNYCGETLDITDYDAW